MADNMWEYWRDKKGIEDALEYQYPEILEKNGYLRLCLHQIKVNELAIDMEMKRLAEVNKDVVV